MKREFLEYIEIERGRAVKTVENYDHYLTRYFEQMHIVHVSDISEQNIREFRLWLNRQPGTGRDSMKRRTQNDYLIALRAFLKFLRKRGIESLSPERIELAKVPERHLDLITALELERLMNEVSVRGKGDKVRVVFLSEASKEAVRAYLKARKDMEEALFVDGRATKLHRITPRDIQRHLKKYTARAGITSKVSPHTLRHVFATDLLSNGADIRSVQALLGHASINTTQIYTHVTDAHLREVHKKYHSKGR